MRSVISHGELSRQLIYSLTNWKQISCKSISTGIGWSWEVKTINKMIIHRKNYVKKDNRDQKRRGGKKKERGWKKEGETSQEKIIVYLLHRKIMNLDFALLK